MTSKGSERDTNEAGTKIISAPEARFSRPSRSFLQMNELSTTGVAKAEGYMELGMFDEAWDVLDALDATDQRLASVLGLRVQILIGTESWAKAEILASSIVAVMPQFALAWYTLAQAYAQQGKILPAKEALTRACAADEKYKVQALVDELLESVW